MKIRNGFVSNSSSSSFVLVGVKLDGSLSKEELAKKYLTEEAIKEYMGDDADKFEGDDKEDWWRDLWYECAWNGDFINKDINYIQSEDDQWIGKVLADNDELDDGEYSISDLNEIVEKMDLEGDCKIYFGTRYC